MSPSSGTGRRIYSRTRHNVWKILGYPMRGRMRVQLLWRRVVPIMSGHALTQWTLRYKTGIVSFVTVGLSKFVKAHFRPQTHSDIYLHRPSHPSRQLRWASLARLTRRLAQTMSNTSTRSRALSTISTPSKKPRLASSHGLFPSQQPLVVCFSDTTLEL